MPFFVCFSSCFRCYRCPRCTCGSLVYKDNLNYANEALKRVEELFDMNGSNNKVQGRRASISRSNSIIFHNLHEVMDEKSNGPYSVFNLNQNNPSLHIPARDRTLSSEDILSSANIYREKFDLYRTNVLYDVDPIKKKKILTKKKLADNIVLLYKIFCEIDRLKQINIKPIIKENKDHSLAGNCQEQSFIACYYLSSFIGCGCCCSINVDIVELEMGNHMFVIIGQKRNKNGQYPKYFRDWSREAVICDPWAGLACYAIEYPEKWNKQMNNWHSKGIRIKTEKGKQISPLDNDWLKVLENKTKRGLLV